MFMCMADLPILFVFNLLIYMHFFSRGYFSHLGYFQFTFSLCWQVFDYSFFSFILPIYFRTILRKRKLFTFIDELN